MNAFLYGLAATLLGIMAVFVAAVVMDVIRGRKHRHRRRRRMPVDRDAPAHRAVYSAMLSAQQSDCANSHLGACIYRVDENGNAKVLSVGYNHLPGRRCSTNCDNRSCGKRSIHAESHAILRVLRANDDLSDAIILRARVKDGALMPAGKPRCVPCAAQIIEVGLAGVWLFHDAPAGWTFYPADEFYRLSVINEDDNSRAGDITTSTCPAAMYNT